MKKTVLILITLFAATIAAAEPLKVVTTTSDLASLTREIGGDKVDVTSIAKGFQRNNFV